MLDFKFKIVNKLRFFGKFHIEGSDLGMGLNKLWDICRLFVLDQKILKFFNLVEELNSRGIIHVATMQKVIWEQLPVSFQVAS